LVSDPEVLLLDEPLQGLPLPERLELLDLRRPRLTVVVVSRDPVSQAGLVDRVALIRAGRGAVEVPVSDLGRRQVIPPLAAGGGATDARG
jgi:ABC-type multidrug transport system ATPase subunit